MKRLPHNLSLSAPFQIDTHTSPVAINHEVTVEDSSQTDVIYNKGRKRQP